MWYFLCIVLLVLLFITFFHALDLDISYFFPMYGLKRKVWNLTKERFIFAFDIDASNASMYKPVSDKNVYLVLMLDDVRSELTSLGAVCTAPKYPKAARDFRGTGPWFDKIADTPFGKADLIIVGDLQVCASIYSNNFYYKLSFSTFRNNGSQMALEEPEFPVCKWRPAWLTQWILKQQILRVFLLGIAATERLASDPGFTHDTSQWPFDADDNPLPPAAA